MDGTLTRPLLDFDAIRRDLGIEGPILEAMRHFTGDRLRDAHAILNRHERLAAEQSELNDGCTELLAWLSERSHRTALITRNSVESTRIILDKHRLRFELVLTREDEPAKPHPEPLHRAMRTLNAARENTWMIGDGSHDIEAAVAAGVTSVWISHGLPRTFAATPTMTVAGLPELLRWLQQEADSPSASVRV